MAEEQKKSFVLYFDMYPSIRVLPADQKGMLLGAVFEYAQSAAERDITPEEMEEIKEKKSMFFMGRGMDYYAVLEGSLKLKEISYIHSEAYQAGELKHGTIALIEEGDMIEINIPAMTLNVDVSDQELAARKEKWQPREPKVTTGYLARYRELVTSGNRGAILEIKKDK